MCRVDAVALCRALRGDMEDHRAKFQSSFLVKVTLCATVRARLRRVPRHLRVATTQFHSVPTAPCRANNARCYRIHLPSTIALQCRSAIQDARQE